MTPIDEKSIDLHVHTMYSDGSFTPAQVVARAKEYNVVAVGITDHDSTDGIEEALKEGSKSGIEVVPGIELSAEFKETPEEEIHILGYFVDWESPALQQKLKLFRQARERRAYHIFQKLQEVGVRLKEQEIFQSAGIGSIGRLHFAKVMLAEGFVRSIKEAFDLYLSFGRPAFVPKFKLEPREAISLILRSGGIPVLAHPYVGNYFDARFIKRLVDDGLKGIEVYHSKHSKSVIAELTLLAEKYELLMTGGSDCHGEVGFNKPLLGSIRVDYHLLEELKAFKQGTEKLSPSIENQLKKL